MPQAMRQFIGLLTATVTLAIGATAAGADPSTQPAEYRAQCDQGYEAGKAVFDPLFQNGKAVAGQLEQGACGEQKHVPKP
jgi:hypothetical protein